MDDEGWHGEHDSTELTWSFAVKDLPTISGFITAGIGFGSILLPHFQSKVFRFYNLVFISRLKSRLPFSGAGYKSIHAQDVVCMAVLKHNVSHARSPRA